MATPNPNQPPPPPPIVGSQVNPAYYIPLPTPKQRKKQLKKLKAKAKAVKVPSGTLAKLDRYTHNRQVSERLIRHVAQNHPGQRVEWCAQKALWDIERDRY